MQEIVSHGVVLILLNPNFDKIFSSEQGEESSPSFLCVDQISSRSPAEQAVNKFSRQFYFWYVVHYVTAYMVAYMVTYMLSICVSYRGFKLEMKLSDLVL
jgi:hypothetical protein